MEICESYSFLCYSCGDKMEETVINEECSSYIKCPNCSSELERLGDIENKLFELRKQFTELEKDYNANAQTLANIRGLTRL